MLQSEVLIQQGVGAFKEFLAVNPQNTVSPVLKFTILTHIFKKNIQAIKHLQMNIIQDQENARFKFDGQPNKIIQLLDKDLSSPLFLYACKSKQHIQTVHEYLQLNIENLENIFKVERQNIIIETSLQIANISHYVIVVLRDNYLINVDLAQQALNDFIQKAIFPRVTLAKLYVKVDCDNTQIPELQYTEVKISEPLLLINNLKYQVILQITSYSDQNPQEIFANIQKTLLSSKTQRLVENGQIYCDKFSDVENLYIKLKNGQTYLKGDMNTINKVHLAIQLDTQSSITNIIQILLENNQVKDILTKSTKDQLSQFFSEFCKSIIEVLGQSDIRISFTRIFQNNLEFEVQCQVNKIDTVRQVLLNKVQKLYVFALSDNQVSRFQNPEIMKQLYGILIRAEGRNYQAISLSEKSDFISTDISRIVTTDLCIFQLNSDPILQLRFYQQYTQKTWVFDYQIQCKQIKDKIYIECRNKDKQDIVRKALEGYVQSFKVSKLILPFTPLELKYLQKYSRNTLKVVESQYKCQFQFQEDLQNNQNRIKIAEFHNKQVWIDTSSNGQLNIDISKQYKFASIRNLNKENFKQQIKLREIECKVLRDLFEKFQQFQVDTIRFTYSQIIEFLGKILQEFFSQKNTYTKQLVFVTETPNLKLQILNQLQYFVENINKQRPQWSWFDASFVEYDDLINQQIEDGYQKYLQNKAMNRIMLKFPCSRQPGTHLVKLNEMTIADYVTTRAVKIMRKGNQFYINNKEVDDSLNIYLLLQEQEGIQSFEVFIKRYEIIFDDIKNHTQANVDSGYRRQIVRNMITSELPKILIEQINKNINQAQMTITPQDQGVTVIGDEQLFPSIHQELRLRVKQSLIVEHYMVPKISDELYSTLFSLLEKYAIQMNGIEGPGSIVEIETFPQYVPKIESIFNQFYTNQEFMTSGYLNKKILDRQSDLYGELQTRWGVQIAEIHEIHNAHLKLYTKSDQEAQYLVFTDSDEKIYQSISDQFPMSSEYPAFIKFGVSNEYIKNKKLLKGQFSILYCEVQVGQLDVQPQHMFNENGNFRIGDYYYVRPGCAIPKYEIKFN